MSWLGLSDVYFANPWVLWLLLLIPALGVLEYFRSRKRETAFLLSTANILNEAERPRTLRERLESVPVYIRLLALAAIFVALARPQSTTSGENVFSEGIDIALVLDVSGSMLAQDFSPNRLEAAKSITDEFIAARKTDRIGLVIFSREAFTQCPLTVDYSVLRTLLTQVKSGMIEDGTAIGNAIANGVNRLKDSDSKTKIMVLLTDGVNNSGEIDPLMAADIAMQFGIRIYTIGVGTYGEAPYPVQTPFGTRYQMVPVEIDENILTEIANRTEGKYFRATGNTQLADIYKEIDKMEKTKIMVTSFQNRKELFLPWVAAALILLLLENLLSKTYLRKLP